MVIKYKSDKGLTLIEILIGIIVSSVMMLAIYTTYSIINTTYGQVVDKASISKSSRDLIEILIKDIRMSGFKYYHGENDKGYPKDTYLDVKGGDVSIAETHDPIVIESDKLGYLRPGDTESDQERKEKIKNNTEKDVCCDRIHIVYDDFDQNDEYQPYKRYKFTYYAKARFGEENEITDGQTTTTRINPRYAIYKSKASWIQKRTSTTGNFPTTGEWDYNCFECYHDQLIRDYVEDMEFIALDKDGKKLTPHPTSITNEGRDNLYKIRAVDIRISFRSKKEFFRFNPTAGKERKLFGFSRNARTFNDRYLRDSVVVTVFTRNIYDGK